MTTPRTQNYGGNRGAYRLKPCPCCGGVAELVRWLGVQWYSQVQCRNCHAAGPAVPGEDYDDRKEPAAAAIQRWQDMRRADA